MRWRTANNRRRIADRRALGKRVFILRIIQSSDGGLRWTDDLIWNSDPKPILALDLSCDGKAVARIDPPPLR